MSDLALALKKPKPVLYQIKPFQTMTLDAPVFMRGRLREMPSLARIRNLKSFGTVQAFFFFPIDRTANQSCNIGMSVSAEIFFRVFICVRSR